MASASRFSAAQRVQQLAHCAPCFGSQPMRSPFLMAWPHLPVEWGGAEVEAAGNLSGSLPVKGDADQLVSRFQALPDCPRAVAVFGDEESHGILEPHRKANHNDLLRAEVTAERPLDGLSALTPGSEPAAGRLALFTTSRSNRGKAARPISGVQRKDCRWSRGGAERLCCRGTRRHSHALAVGGKRRPETGAGPFPGGGGRWAERASSRKMPCQCQRHCRGQQRAQHTCRTIRPAEKRASVFMDCGRLRSKEQAARKEVGGPHDVFGLGPNGFPASVRSVLPARGWFAGRSGSGPIGQARRDVCNAPGFQGQAGGPCCRFPPATLGWPLCLGTFRRVTGKRPSRPSLCRFRRQAVGAVVDLTAKRARQVCLARRALRCGRRAACGIPA